MIGSVAIFLHTTSRYGVLELFSRAMGLAFQNAGFKCYFLEGMENDEVAILQRDDLAFTLSFNGVPTLCNRPITAISGKPHIACLVDPLHHYLPLLHLEGVKVSVADRSSLKMLPKGQERCFFLPHAARRLDFIESKDKALPIAFFSTFIDREPVCFGADSAKVHALIDELAASFLNHPKVPYVDLAFQAIEADRQLHALFLQRRGNLYDFLAALELAIKGLDRVKLLEHIERPVHVFGSSRQQSAWQDALGHKTPHHFHGAVSVQQVLEVMASARVVLNSCPTISDGGHERVFSALLKKAAVLTSYSGYLQEEFSEEDGVFSYRFGQWEEANEQIERILQDGEGTQLKVQKGAEKVLSKHTYEARAATLLRLLEREPVSAPGLN